MLMSFRKNHKQAAQSGQNLVELALIFPFLMIVLFGVLDLGRVFFVTVNLTNAARESVRFLTRYPDDLSIGFTNTKDIAIEEAGYLGITLEYGQINVLCQDTSEADGICDSGYPATVDVSYDFELILSWLLPDDISLTRTAVMIVP
jgi:Flp pilus assembly protein TadG